LLDPRAEVRNFDKLYIRQPRWWVGALLVVYALLATTYALYTPRWQTPDEPAHFNYIQHIATTYQLPVLQMGDYNQELLTLLLNLRFPDGAPVQQLRYQSYQPPLYYLTATPIYWVTGGSLLALRLWGVLLGGGVLVLIYRTLELVFPGKPLISVSATAFAALLPMHLAVLAAVNNDGLAELLVVGALFVLLRWMHGQFYTPAQDPTPSILHPPHRGQLLWLGCLLGLGLLTKVYAYALIPICFLTVIVVVWRWQPGGTLLKGVGSALWVLIPAVGLALPWWVRNWLLYGPWDLLGTAWHDQVVIGQPRTATWIATEGWSAYLERALSYTFRSFWGVFGWMSVFMDERVYTALLLFTGVLFLGLLWSLVRLISGGQDLDMDGFQIGVLALFGVTIAAVVAAYGWYNLKFVQHQGRYFLWGLLPISTFVALGWREVLRPLQGLITGILASVLMVSLTIIGWVSGAFAKWTLLITGLMTCFLLSQPLLHLGRNPASTHPLARLASRPAIQWTLALGRSIAWLLPFGLLTLLNLLIPVLYILPQVGPGE